jgi:hypothetical protein
MIYSDYYPTKERDVIIEILPTDNIDKQIDILVKGDIFISVFRPVNGSFVTNRLKESFIPEFQSYCIQQKYTIKDSLAETIKACNYSFLCPPADPDLIPEQGAMVLVIYINQNGVKIMAQVGPITAKKRIDSRFITITENHTFDNQKEMNRLLESDFFRKYYKPEDVNLLLNTMAIKEGLCKVSNTHNIQLKKHFLKGIPSRFIGHPSYCSMGGELGETIINTKPFITTI